MKPTIDKLFIASIKQFLTQAQQNVLKQVNYIMVQTYFELGKQIIEHEQKGKNEANYGTYLLEELSINLTKEFGKGFSKRNLELIRKFYISYRFAKSTISQSLSWTHYIQLMRIDSEDERSFYQIESQNNNWSVRELSRQINSDLYNRLLLSKDKKDTLVEITLPKDNHGFLIKT